MKFLFYSVLFLYLVACSTEEPYRLEPQKWEDTIVEIETRPSPPQAGMNEFILIATRDRSMPVNNLIVSIRSNESQNWKQAIQDGYTGVYRTAILVEDPAANVLQVQLRETKGKKEKILSFPINKTGTQ